MPADGWELLGAVTSAQLIQCIYIYGTNTDPLPIYSWDQHRFGAHIFKDIQGMNTDPDLKKYNIFDGVFLRNYSILLSISPKFVTMIQQTIIQHLLGNVFVPNKH